MHGSRRGLRGGRGIVQELVLASQPACAQKKECLGNAYPALHRLSKIAKSDII